MNWSLIRDSFLNTRNYYFSTIVVSHADSLIPPDCLVLLVFKDKSDKAQGNKERASVTLEEICGLEVGQCYEGVSFTLAILCLNHAALLGFDSKEALQAWDVRLRYSLGEGEETRWCFVFDVSFFWWFTCGAFCSKTFASMWICFKFLQENTTFDLLYTLIKANSQQPDQFIHHAGRFQCLKCSAVKEKYPAICQTLWTNLLILVVSNEVRLHLSRARSRSQKQECNTNSSNIA